MTLTFNSKLKTLAFALALGWGALAQAESSPCDTIDNLPALVKEGQFLEAFNRFLSVTGENNQYCFGNAQRENNAITGIVFPWGDALFADIFQGDKITFDLAQTRRLKNNAQTIRYIKKNLVGVNDIENWRITFLNLALDLAKEDTKEATKIFQDKATRAALSNITEGYLSNEDNKKLPANFANYHFDDMLQKLKEMRNLVKYESDEDLIVSRQIFAASSTEQGEGVKVVSPIRFRYDSTTLNEQGQQVLSDNMKLFKSNTTINNPKGITIIGHTDTKGDAQYNCWLSQCRAKAIKQRFIAQGFDANKIHVGWAGENVPHVEEKDTFFRNIVPVAVDGKEDVTRRRVEFEIGGQNLLEKYQQSGQLCVVSAAYVDRPCPD